METKSNKIRETNPDFFYFNIPDIIAEVVRLLVENEKMTVISAINLVYGSEVYKKLKDKETGYWLKEPFELYQELTNPINQ